MSADLYSFRAAGRSSLRRSRRLRIGWPT